MNIVIQLSFRFGPHSHRIPGNPSDPSHPFRVAYTSTATAYSFVTTAYSSSHTLPPGYRALRRFSSPSHTPRVYTPPPLLLPTPITVYTYYIYYIRGGIRVRSRPPGLYIYIHHCHATSFFVVVVASTTHTHTHIYILYTTTIFRPSYTTNDRAVAAAVSFSHFTRQM